MKPASTLMREVDLSYTLHNKTTLPTEPPQLSPLHYTFTQ